MSLFTTTIERLNLQRFFYGDGPQVQPVKLHHKKVYILPTRNGYIFVLLLIVMLIGSINYDNSLGYMLTFLLGSLSVVTILFTYRNLLGLQISIATPSSVYAGQNIAIPVSVFNPGLERFSIKVHASESLIHQLDVAAESTHRASVLLPVSRRGLYSIPRLTFSSTFPLGLFRAWSYVEIQQNYLVYPKPAGKHQLPVYANYLFSEQGDRGLGSDDFVGLRSYQNGDSLRHVNWKALAKQQGMQTKQFGGDRSNELWLEWSATAGHIEQRISQLCLWIIEASRANISYGLRLPAAEIKPSSGDHHKHRCLKALALLSTNQKNREVIPDV